MNTTNVMIIDTTIDVKYYKRKIIKNEKKIIQKYPAKTWDYKNDFDGNTGLGNQSLTSRSCHFNVLNWWGVNSLKNNIKKYYFQYLNISPQPIYVQCWANVMRNGQQIKPHNHRSSKETLLYSSVSGNLIVSVDNESYTYYGDCPVLNLGGRMVLFPSDTVHHTSIYTGSAERISIAFDIKNQKDWEEDVYESAKSHWVKI